MRLIILKVVISSLFSLSAYLLVGSIFNYHWYFLYFVVIVLTDIIGFKWISRIGLYFIIPILSLFLLLFDHDSIFRSFKYIIFCPLLYTFCASQINKYRNVIGATIIISFCYFVANPNWESAYKTINNTNKKIELSEVDLELYDLNGNKFVPKKRNTILLDFWFTGCSQCYKDMAKIDELLIKYPKLRDRIYIVNVPLKNEEHEKNFLLVKKYKLNYLYTKKDFEFLRKHGVYEFPKQILIKNNFGEVMNVSTDPLVFSKYLPNLF